MWRHHVYIHRKATNGEPFYVGKASRRDRPYSRLRRNPIWHKIVKKHGLVVEVVAHCIDDTTAQALERDLIAHFGRRTIGTGLLINLTDGGDGHAGYSPSEETRKKMSEAAKGKKRTEAQRLAVSLAQRGKPNPPEQSLAHSLRMSGKRHPFFGKKRSQSFIDKISGHNSKVAKKVIDHRTGEAYDSIKNAAAAIGVRRPTLSRWLSGRYVNPTSLRYA